MAKVFSSMSPYLSNQLTRSLEKILEEAHLGGELKLSGRKLKEFPRTGGKYDLSDTVTADLSKNRFWELPVEVTKFWSLEKLQCYHNAIRSVPESVVFLQSLVYLDLRSLTCFSRNHLTSLPAALCQLPLEILLVANNRLTTLPEEIGRCNSLMEFDVSCNQITHLPPQMGQLSRLRMLNVRNNLLLELPIEVTYLKLFHMDLSENRIATLPVELRTMNSLVSLELSHNPLVSPPASICVRGRVHVFKYLELRSVKEDKVRWRGGVEERKVSRKLSELRARQQHRRHHNTSPGDSSINNSDETLNELGKKRLERSSSEREVSRQNSSESGIKSLSSSSLGSRYSKSGQSMNGLGSGTSLSPTAEQTNQDDQRPFQHVQSYNLGSRYSKSGQSMNGLGSGTSLSPTAEQTNQDDQRPFQHVQSYKEYKEALRAQRAADNIYKSRNTSSEDHTPSPTYQHANNHVNESDSPGHKTDSSPSPGHEVKRPVQKVIPSRNLNYVPLPPPTAQDTPAAVNGCTAYVKPSAPQLLTTSLGYVGTTPPPPRPAAWNRNIPPDKLSFTMRREFEKAKEEAELIQQLRSNIETRLKMTLPADLAPALSDGVVLCHLANHVRPRSVASIHVPSPAVPKLTTPRCRRNVDNFLEACRRIGVEENLVCCAGDVLEGRGMVQVAITVAELLRFHQPRSPAHVPHPPS